MATQRALLESTKTSSGWKWWMTNGDDEELDFGGTDKQTPVLAYQNLELSELKTFAKDRGLSSEGDVAQLSTTLREADENAKFTCFARLPDDIRLCFYDEYFAEFSGMVLPIGCVQAPLTRCTNLLRNETLQLFYRKCNFRLSHEFYVDYVSGNARWDTPTNSLIHRLEPQMPYFRNLNHLHVRIRAWTLPYAEETGDFKLRDLDDWDATVDAHIKVSETPRKWSLTLPYTFKNAEPDLCLSHLDDDSDWTSWIEIQYKDVLREVVQRPRAERWGTHEFAHFVKSAVNLFRMMQHAQIRS